MGLMEEALYSVLFGKEKTLMGRRGFLLRRVLKGKERKVKKEGSYSYIL